MKNFYEATIIKPDLKLKMILDLEAISICPCQIKINDSLEFYGDLVGKNTFIKHLPLTEPITVEIIVERQHPQAIEIVRLTIDGYEVMPLYLNQSNPPTNYLNFTGSWFLKISDFYPWYHEITGQGWII
jgi:hypothetical protein